MNLLQFNSHRLFCMSIGLVTAIVLILCSYTPFEGKHYAWYDSVENYTFDKKQRLRPSLFGPAPESSDIVHIDINDKSIDLLGRWPWNRSVHGDLVEVLKECDAKLTMFDVEFYREQQVHVDEKQFNRKAQKLKSDLPGLQWAEAFKAVQPFQDELQSRITQDPPDTLAKALYQTLVESYLPKMAKVISRQVLQHLQNEMGSLKSLTTDHDAYFIRGVRNAGNVILPFHWTKADTLDPRFNLIIPNSNGRTALEVMERTIRVQQNVTNKALGKACQIPESIIARDRGMIASQMYLEPEEPYQVLKQFVSDDIYISTYNLREFSSKKLLESMKEDEDYLIDGEPLLKPDGQPLSKWEWFRLTDVNVSDNLYRVKENIIRDLVIDDLNNSELIGEVSVEQLIDDYMASAPPRDLNTLLETLETQIYDKLYTSRFTDPSKLFTQEEKHYRLCFDRAIAAIISNKIGPIGVQDSSASLPIDKQQEEMEPSLYPLLLTCFDTGFVSIEVDSDGILRRAPLVMQSSEDGRYYPQIAFQTMLHSLNVDSQTGIQIELGKYIHIKDADYGNGDIRDIDIPIDDEGKILINWAGTYSGDADHWKAVFQHVDYVKVYNIADQRQALQNVYKKFMMAVLADAYNSRRSSAKSAIGKVYDRMPLQTTQPELDAILNDTSIRTLDEYESKLMDAIRAMTIDEALPELIESYGKALGEFKKFDLKKYPPRRRQKVVNPLHELNFFLIEWKDNIKEYQESVALIKEEVSGKICLIGSAHTGSTDFKPTPIHPSMPGVMLHSNIMNMMLQPDLFLKPAGYGINLLFILCLALFVSFFASVVSVQVAILLSVGGAAAILVGHTFAMAQFSLNFDTFLPMIVSLFATTTIIGYRYMTEDKKRRFLKSSFEKFISKDYVAELIKNPDKLKLGGETRYMTAHFSDIQGFSTFSEILTPDKLVHVLNIYLTRMTDIINEHKGTIDKYEGDAVIAFFNAPLDDDNHFENSVEGGLQELRALKDVNEKLHEDGSLPSDVSIKVRVGLNSGEMVVGNMGSEKVFNYTMMGDNVNLAARLEGANKPFGTFFMIGSKTYEGCKEKFIFRRLAKLIVMGRKSAEPVYEPLGRPGEVSDKSKEMIKFFHTALDKFGDRKWDEAENDFKFLISNYSDSASKRYLNLIPEYRKRTDLPDNWSGEIELTEK